MTNYLIQNILLEYTIAICECLYMTMYRLPGSYNSPMYRITDNRNNNCQEKWYIFEAL